MIYLSDQEFEQRKKKYMEENSQYDKTMIFHVGVCAGFYSEIVSMMECMCYCHLHKIRFVLYADDANFSQNGWNDLFSSFCEENHDDLNHVANLRYVPERIDRKCKYMMQSFLLKKRNQVDYVTSDCFLDIISAEMKKTHIRWELFGMDGMVYPEIAKLFSFALRYTKQVKNEVDVYKQRIALPEHYTSIQIRGGDKILERNSLVGVQECVEIMQNSKHSIENLFVFTDDYRNIEFLKEHTSWNIYTLAKPKEKGYVNLEFQKQPWETRRENIIKLFAMVELCVDSELHFGYEAACVNNFIKNYKPQSTYEPIFDAMEKNCGV